MATQSTLPNLTQDARLYKYVRVPDSGWKYLRANYDENFLKPHSVFLPKSVQPVCIEGGYYVASDEGKWHRLSEDPAEAWRRFKLCRVQGQMREPSVYKCRSGEVQVWFPVNWRMPSVHEGFVFKGYSESSPCALGLATSVPHPTLFKHIEGNWYSYSF
jgi:hypothetical protein